jgi:hypothetical protein
MKFTFKKIAAVGFLALGSMSASASVINIDFQGPGGSPSVAGVLYTGYGILGETFDTTWNAASVGTTSNLLDGSGVLTGASVSVSNVGTYANAGNVLLSDRIIFGPTNTETVTVSGLAANATFNIAAYNGFYSQDYSIIGHATESVIVASGSWNADVTSWVEGMHYAQFESVISNSFGEIEIDFTSNPAGPYGAYTSIAGLQIESVSVPEPASLGMLCLGLLGLALKRRA